MTAPEAFMLLTLPNAYLSTPTTVQRGTLNVECVTVSNVTPGQTRDVFLVLRLGSFETPVDPSRTVTMTSDVRGARTYKFLPCESDPGEMTIGFPPVTEGKTESFFAADLNTFDGILEQYTEFRGSDAPHLRHTNAGIEVEGGEDLRGKLVLVDETNGQVLGTVGDQHALRTDPSLSEAGHEGEPVIIDVGPGKNGVAELHPREVFVQSIPPGEHNLVTRTAQGISYVISGGATLITSGMHSASNYYVRKAVPHPSANPEASREAGTPPPPPPRAVAWLTSDSTKRGLHTAHQASGKAVQVSAKTVSKVQSFVKTTVHKHAGKIPIPAAAQARLQQANSPPPPPPPRPEGLRLDTKIAPGQNGPYSAYSGTYKARKSTTTLPPAYSEKPRIPPRVGATPPPLPPRGSPVTRSTSAPPLPSPSISAQSNAGPSNAAASDQQQPQKLRARDTLILSAKLIFSTIDHSTKKILEAGSESVNAAVGHKYGAEAEHSTRMLTGTVRNVGLVYVDIRGLGHRAILKTAGVEVVKARMSNGKNVEIKPGAAGTVEEVTVTGTSEPPELPRRKA